MTVRLLNGWTGRALFGKSAANRRIHRQNGRDAF